MGKVSCRHSEKIHGLLLFPVETPVQAICCQFNPADKVGGDCLPAQSMNILPSTVHVDVKSITNRNPNNTFEPYKLSKREYVPIRTKTETAPNTEI